MRLLLVNPNTSQFVTDAVTAEARRVASPGTEIKGVTGTMGAPIIGCRADNAVGTYMAVELAVEHAADCDAVLLAVSFDSGLGALRELLSIPVVGMSEAAMLTACMLGRRFAMLTFGARAVPLYEDLVRSYGLQEHFAGMVALPALTDAELKDPILLKPRLMEQVEIAVNQQGADVVALTGAIFAGLVPRLQDASPVPLVDGIACGVRMAEMLAQVAYTKARAGSYRLPARKDMSGVGPALAALYRNLPED